MPEPEPVAPEPGFTHVDPFEDTESPAARRVARSAGGFTHVDPFEDTERASTAST